MDPLTAAKIAALATIVFMVTIWPFIRPRGYCPSCSQLLPLYKVPVSWQEVVRGGRSCPSCGCSFDNHASIIEAGTPERAARTRQARTVSIALHVIVGAGFPLMLTWDLLGNLSFSLAGEGRLPPRAGPKWQPFTPPGGAFTVNLPGKPEAGQLRLWNEGEWPTLRVWTCTTTDPPAVWRVGYVKLEKSDVYREDPDGLLLEVHKDINAERGVSDRRLSANPPSGAKVVRRGLQFMTPDDRGRDQIVLTLRDASTDTWVLYYMDVRSPVMRNDDLKDFFGSLKVHDVPID